MGLVATFLVRWCYHFVSREKDFLLLGPMAVGGAIVLVGWVWGKIFMPMARVVLCGLGYRFWSGSGFWVMLSQAKRDSRFLCYVEAGAMWAWC